MFLPESLTLNHVVEIETGTRQAVAVWTVMLLIGLIGLAAVKRRR